MHLTPISPHDTLEPILEPLDSLLLVDTVAGANLALASSSLGDALTRSCPLSSSVISPKDNIASRSTKGGISHAAVEVHSVDTNCRVILDSQIDVLANSETEVAGF